jgi:hypothetical protein
MLYLTLGMTDNKCFANWTEVKVKVILKQRHYFVHYFFQKLFLVCDKLERFTKPSTYVLVHYLL